METKLKPLKLFTVALQEIKHRSYNCDQYNLWNPIPKSDKVYQVCHRLKTVLQDPKYINPTQINALLKLSPLQSRGIASLLGLAISDALGASTQFMPFDKKRKNIINDGFKEMKALVMNGRINNRGQVGVWTDDCSMALCLADSILLNNFEFKPKDLRQKFTFWLHYGLNNGGRPHSIGLGGNISISMQQYLHRQDQYTQEGNKFNNGNGSLMRLAPSAIGYHHDLNLAKQISRNQSRTTHNGQQAYQCCRLLAEIIVRLMHRDNQKKPKELLLQICDSFETKLKSVQFLAKGKMQTYDMFEEAKHANSSFIKFNKSPEKDRNWNWRSEEFTYSETRYKQNKGYIGSYCMDALAMSLHVAYFSESFFDGAIRSTNMGGDCDTVGAITAQITGAMYGLDKQMLRLYSQMPDVQYNRYLVFTKAWKLVKRQAINI